MKANPKPNHTKASVRKLIAERDELHAALIELVGCAQPLAVLSKRLGKLVGVNGRKRK